MLKAMAPDFEASLPEGMGKTAAENKMEFVIVNFTTGDPTPANPYKDVETGLMMVTGFVMQDRKYCLTLLTKQRKGDIRKAMKGGSSVVKGRLSRKLFTGDGGETYRPMLGRITSDKFGG